MVKLHIARDTRQRVIAVRVAWLPDAGRAANRGSGRVPDDQEVVARRVHEPYRLRSAGVSYFEIVIGIPTFSIRPMVVWNKMLRIRKVVRFHTVSFTE